MSEQNKSSKGIKIIAGLMLIVGLWIIVWEVVLTVGLIARIDKVLIGSSIAEDIFIGKEDGSVVTSPLSTKDFLKSVLLPYIDDLLVMTETIIIGPLLIIASIGLWKIKVWGLLMAMMAMGAKFSMDVLYILFYYTGYVKTGFAIESDGGNWCVLALCFCILILSIISVVYLYRKRRCFS